ncbi:MAG TPA: AAA family ATPase [Thermoanaerobaculia bacterium]|nr:AAA family ATPase [Thermoanaerobaculia bacterium]
MTSSAPSVIALAGPNGAGKSTAGPALVREALGVTELVNADVIAQGLSAFDPEGVALTAGKVMLTRLHELASRRATFAFETTLAGRAYARWLTELKSTGYEIHILFLWLPTVELAIRRVSDRVRRGGHGIPAATIRRRYNAGLRNFFGPYRAMASTWRFYDNSSSQSPVFVAKGQGAVLDECTDRERWLQLERTYG